MLTFAQKIFAMWFPTNCFHIATASSRASQSASHFHSLCRNEGKPFHMTQQARQLTLWVAYRKRKHILFDSWINISIFGYTQNKKKRQMKLYCSCLFRRAMGEWGLVRWALKKKSAMTGREVQVQTFLSRFTHATAFSLFQLEFGYYRRTLDEPNFGYRLCWLASWYLYKYPIHIYRLRNLLELINYLH